MDRRYQYSIWRNEKAIDGNRKFNRGRRPAGSEIPAVSPVDPADGRRRLYLDYGRLMADKCLSLPVLQRAPRRS